MKNIIMISYNQWIALKRIFLSIILFFLLSSSSNAKVSIVAYRGWNNCYQIENKFCKIIILPEVGGRIMNFTYKGKNIIFEDPAQDGLNFQDWQNKKFDPDGGRFDVGPEKTTQPIHGKSWMGPWKTEVTGKYSIKITSMADDELGLLSTREFILHPDSAILTVNLTAENISGKELVRHFWGRTLLKPGGEFIMPMNHNSRFESGWGRFMWNPNRIEPSSEKDERINIKDNIFHFRAVGSTIKGGTDSEEGWMAYKWEGLNFIKKYKVNPEENYSGSDHMTSIFYSNGRFIELEPVSPTYTMKPGEVIKFSEKWIMVDSNGKNILNQLAKPSKS